MIISAVNSILLAVSVPPSKRYFAKPSTIVHGGSPPNDSRLVTMNAPPVWNRSEPTLPEVTFAHASVPPYRWELSRYHEPPALNERVSDTEIVPLLWSSDP